MMIAITAPRFSKFADGLMPCIVQDEGSRQVLMLGYMNEASFQKTLDTKLVCFYSRSRQQLWTKGETSGNYLQLVDIRLDCDEDCLLALVKPAGPVCHTGADNCFNLTSPGISFLYQLEQTIAERKKNPAPGSYVSTLFAKGINKIAQKVGEEAVELVIEAKDNDEQLFKEEAADLLFHFMILLQAKGIGLEDIAGVLQGRSR